jgi:UDP-glucose 4-epimerase
MSKQVIVFGGSGFLGSHVADALSDSGHKVTVFDQIPSSYLRSDQTMIVGDILDAEQVRQAMKDQDIAYHFAGLADLDRAADKPLEAVNQNIVGTMHLLDAAVASKVERFVYASTIYVYSRLGGFYRCSKQATELFIEEYNNCYGLEFTVLRYGSLYGPRANEGNGIRRFLSQGLTEGKIIYPGTGDEVREYINVKDAARLSADILAPEYKNQHIVVTGHNPMKSREMLEMIREMVNREISLEFSNASNNFHYTLTPYSFTPKIGSKLVSNLYTDMGQGLLECLQEISRKCAPSKTTD